MCRTKIKKSVISTIFHRKIPNSANLAPNWEPSWANWRAIETLPARVGAIALQLAQRLSYLVQIHEFGTFCPFMGGLGLKLERWTHILASKSLVWSRDPPIKRAKRAFFFRKMETGWWFFMRPGRETGGDGESPSYSLPSSRLNAEPRFALERSLDADRSGSLSPPSPTPGQ